LNLSALGSSQAGEAVRLACLNKADLTPSMELSRESKRRASGAPFPSVGVVTINLVVYAPIAVGGRLRSKTNNKSSTSEANCRKNTSEETYHD